MKLKRGLALFTAIVLLLLYAGSIVFAVIGSPLAQSLLMTSFFCTIVLPAVLYGYMVYLRHAKGRSSTGFEDNDNTPKQSQ